MEWVDATSAAHAAQLLADGNAMAKAGGIDVLDLLKEGVIAPGRLVNLRSIPGLNGIQQRASGELEIGAMTTLAQIASDPVIREKYTALSEAAGHAATPQVRNAGTLGGNLLQKPRCWYYRNAFFHGEAQSARDSDPARSGENQFHAIFDNGSTSMVHSSTPATALAAFDARVELVDANGGERSVPLREFLVPADFKTGRVSVIRPGEVLTHVVLPATPVKSAYHKQTERDSYDWPICDVAVVLGASASVFLGWVAPVPYRAVESERILTGKQVDQSLAAQAAKAAVAGATPLSKNAYKVPILEAVVRRTILKAAGI